MDTGGTFTDCVAVSPAGDLHRAKVLSSSTLRFAIDEVVDATTIRLRDSWPRVEKLLNGFTASFPRSGAVGIVDAFDAASGSVRLQSPVSGLGPGDAIHLQCADEAPVLAARIVTKTAPGADFPPIRMRLATTRGTNALLERRGHPPVLFITKGFGDLLEIGTQARPELFARDIIKPAPLYARTVEVNERLTADGSVLRELDEEALRHSARELRQEGHTVAAVALMHSYLNPAHEERVAAILEEEGFGTVRCSARLAPLIRLLPRAQTTVVDAYLSPIIDQTIRRVREGIGEESLQSLHLMTSAGGLVLDHMFHPKDSLLSGPAGGVVGISFAARGGGFSRVIGFDMGGTSTDVARWDGEYCYDFEHRIGDATLVAPAMSIESVAAGGGSVCHFGEGRLQVGPQSAGANPGPACYGAGGPLTITDVNLLLGRLVIESFEIPLDVSAANAAAEALRNKVETETGEKVGNVAMLEGLLAIANERMAAAIRQVSVGQGYDPSEYTLVAFGGAGGQHACAIAELLGIDTILVPADASLLSALGLGQAAIERIAERQVLAPLDQHGPDGLLAIISELENQARDSLREEGTSDESPAHVRVMCSLRYVGQDATLTVDWDRESDLAALFERRYEETFAYLPEGRTIEVESVRIVVSVPSSGLTPEVVRADPAELPTKLQDCHFRGNWRKVPVLRCEDLGADGQRTGPALIVGRSTVILVDEGWVMVPNHVDGVVLTRLAKGVA